MEYMRLRPQQRYAFQMEYCKEIQRASGTELSRDLNVQTFHISPHTDKNQITMETKKTNEHHNLELYLCLITGYIIRFFFCLRFFVQPRDAYLYERFIINWEKNGRIIDKIEYFPLSLWLMKLPHDLFGFEIMKGGIIVNILLGLGIIIIGMKTAEIVFHNRVTTLFVGLILATHPTIVSLSCSFLRDTAYLFFGTASLYFFAVYWKKEDLFSLIANSMLATFSFLCRLEGFEITVIFSAILLFLAISRKEKKIRVVFRFFLYYAIFLATMLLTCICLGLSEKNYNHITIRINRQIINRFISF